MSVEQVDLGIALLCLVGALTFAALHEWSTMCAYLALTLAHIRLAANA